ncbi:APC family permease [Clostridium sp. WILCCON 0269]|uniref:APC family permease n=1 Tax=Candidatus Clostridium eludens TaxID=3381663 RepID=A0ABW8STH9_9CLOT
MNVTAENSNLKSGLKEQCLNFSEVIGQSIANIAPSVGPALGIPMVYASSGNGTWLTYIFATFAVLLVGYHINQFAKRSSSPGSLYTYVADGLGSGAGFLSGWSLVIAYMLTGCATLAGFSNYVNVVGSYFGIKLPAIGIVLVGLLIAGYLVYKDVSLSAKFMLILEGISLALIFTLGIIVLSKNGFRPDMTQIKLQGVSFNSLRLGLVLAFFSFVGFESATSLGAEAKSPLKNIPKAVIISAIFVGVLFVVFSYIEVMGFVGSPTKLSESTAPLNYLADHNGVGFMGIIIAIGSMVSFWSCAVACITAAARILMSMAKDNILHPSLGETHAKNNTPHVSIGVILIIIFIIPAILLAKGSKEMDIFGWLGTIATLGFLFSYAMILLSVPPFLHRIKELKPKDVIIAIFSTLILSIPIIGSVYPLPAYPYSLFPFLFLAWLILGGSWYAIMNVYKQGKANKNAGFYTKKQKMSDNREAS